jgi:hypothetical protein
MLLSLYVAVEEKKRMLSPDAEMKKRLDLR